MRLIDADAIHYTSGLIINGMDVVYATRKNIDSQPTIDPVKHGRWMDGGRNYNTWWHKCSCCYANFTDLRVMTYCPACGAKMDEKLGDKNDRLY